MKKGPRKTPRGPFLLPSLKFLFPSQVRAGHYVIESHSLTPINIDVIATRFRQGQQHLVVELAAPIATDIDHRESLIADKCGTS